MAEGDREKGRGPAGRSSRPRRLAVREHLVSDSAKTYLKDAVHQIHDSIPAKPYIVTSVIAAGGVWAVAGADKAGETLVWAGTFLAISKLFRRKWWKYAFLASLFGAVLQDARPLGAATLALLADILYLATIHTKTGLNEHHPGDHH